MKVKLTKRQLIVGAALLALLLIGLLVYRYHGTWELVQHRVFNQDALVAQVRRHRAVDIGLVVPLLICFFNYSGRTRCDDQCRRRNLFWQRTRCCPEYYWDYAGKFDCTAILRPGDCSSDAKIVKTRDCDR